MLLHACKQNTGPCYASFLQAHKSWNTRVELKTSLHPKITKEPTLQLLPHPQPNVPSSGSLPAPVTDSSISAPVSDPTLGGLVPHILPGGAGEMPCTAAGAMQGMGTATRTFHLCPWVRSAVGAGHIPTHPVQSPPNTHLRIPTLTSRGTRAWPWGQSHGQGKVAVPIEPTQEPCCPVPTWEAFACLECSFLPNSLAHRCSTMASDFISLSHGGHTVVPGKRKEVKTIERWREASTSSTAEPNCPCCQTATLKGDTCPCILPRAPSSQACGTTPYWV